MAEHALQTRKNHARLDPAFHFFLAPVLVLFVLWTLYRCVFTVVFTVRHWSAAVPGSTGEVHSYLITGLLGSVGLLLMALALLVLAFKVRLYSLKVQDRVIRLEERIRLMTLAPDPLRSRVGALTERQLIALRFASDDEVVRLAGRALDENLTSGQIKDAIVVWRPDHFRV